MKISLIALGLLVSVTSFASTYEDYFPHYYEYCTGSQVKYKKEYFNGASGGKGGHGFMYIHGLCKDYSKSYPQVIPCSLAPKENSSFPHEGVGVSLDSDFKNVAWVAVPGRNLTLFGKEQNKSPLNVNDVNEIVDAAVDLRIFTNVRMKNSSIENEMALASVGTNIAVNLGRDLHCIKIPVDEKAIASAANYLNDFNNQYYLKEKEFKWSMISNNCTHLALNTSFSMGLNNSIAVDKSLFDHLGDLAIPSNAYLMYVDKTIGTTKRLFPAQVGVLIANHSAIKNPVFHTNGLRSFTLFRRNILKMFTNLNTYKKYLKKKENTDLQASAEKWYPIYSKQLDKSTNLKSDNLLNSKKMLSLEILENY